MRDKQPVVTMFVLDRSYLTRWWDKHEILEYLFSSVRKTSCARFLLSISRLRREEDTRNDEGREDTHLPTKFSSTELLPALWPPTTAICGRSSCICTPSCVNASCSLLTIGINCSMPVLPAILSSESRKPRYYTARSYTHARAPRHAYNTHTHTDAGALLFSLPRVRESRFHLELPMPMPPMLRHRLRAHVRPPWGWLTEASGRSLRGLTVH